MSVLPTLQRLRRRTSAMTLALALLATVTSAATPLRAAAATVPTSAAFSTGAKVSFTFDDGIGTNYSLAAGALAQYGFPGTAYIITKCIGMTTTPNTCAANPDVAYMTWAQVKALHDTYGWEIGSHTVDHPLTAAVDNPSLTDAQLNAEMADSKAALAAQGFNATDFASPYGDYDNRSLAAIAKYYDSHRAFQDITQPAAAEVTNTFPYYSPRSTFPYNPMMLTVMQVQGNVPVATVEQYINQAKANNQWLILVFHNVVSSGASTLLDDYQYNVGDLSTIAAYVKSQNIPVTDINHGLANSSTNLLANGGFDSGIAGGWTTDNSTAIQANLAADNLNGHGAFDGTANGARSSVLLKGAAADTHLFSPTVSVDPTQTYVLKNFVNVTSTSGEVDFYVDEYDANGTWLSGQYHNGIAGTTTANAVQVGDINFTYKPTSATVAKARLQVIAHGANLTAYYDNAQWFPESAIGSTSTGGGSTGGTTATGDLNGDSKVDALDLSTLLSNWNKSGATAAQGDLNADGVVNALDLSTLLSNWSK